ncbi:nitrogen fixation protein NifQ [Rhodocyclus tenuis]|uniref:nitrogen fixation protein NifQ n=1 Tax=Rhodocyclus gracilis TaxID=2929842 RepID=UPI0012989EE7|nr:nitrogen fixation protein NifQ [Rhodocyclus gracilis]MRD72385.1 nitrogen fixation protein NifQ [Rhodocyclus gracilis]
MLPEQQAETLPESLRHALIGVIRAGIAAQRTPPIRGLAPASWHRLLQALALDEASLACPPSADAATPAATPLAPDETTRLRAATRAIEAAEKFNECDEFDELLELLLAQGQSPSEAQAWLAYAMASSAMGENHLWQDMGLPSRDALSALMAEYFPALYAANSGNMKWKKFFYRQLCARAGIPICKSPHCADCHDYSLCFAPEN